MTKDCMINFKHYKSILCLSGDLPPSDFFKQDLPIIAADGATNNLIKMDIVPEIAIGDLDSITPENRAKVKTHYHYDQNYCDFQKALRYLEENQLLPAVIVGINGGFLDHVLNNINHFVDTDSVLYAPPIYGYTLREHENKTFTLPPDSKLSLMGMPTVKLSTTGLKWNLSKATLSFPGLSSCFNRSTDETVEITIHEGRALILIYDRPEN